MNSSFASVGLIRRSRSRRNSRSVSCQWRIYMSTDIRIPNGRSMYHSPIDRSAFHKRQVGAASRRRRRRCQRKVPQTPHCSSMTFVTVRIHLLHHPAFSYNLLPKSSTSFYPHDHYAKGKGMGVIFHILRGGGRPRAREAIFGPGGGESCPRGTVWPKGNHGIVIGQAGPGRARVRCRLGGNGPAETYRRVTW